MSGTVLLPFWLFLLVGVLAAWAAYDKLLMPALETVGRYAREIVPTFNRLIAPEAICP